MPVIAVNLKSNPKIGQKAINCISADLVLGDKAYAKLVKGPVSRKLYACGACMLMEAFTRAKSASFCNLRQGCAIPLVAFFAANNCGSMDFTPFRVAIAGAEFTCRSCAYVRFLYLERTTALLAFEIHTTLPGFIPAFYRAVIRRFDIGRASIVLASALLAIQHLSIVIGLVKAFHRAVLGFVSTPAKRFILFSALTAGKGDFAYCLRAGLRTVLLSTFSLGRQPLEHNTAVLTGERDTLTAITLSATKLLCGIRGDERGAANGADLSMHITLLTEYLTLRWVGRPVSGLDW